MVVDFGCRRCFRLGLEAHNLCDGTDDAAVDSCAQADGELTG